MNCGHCKSQDVTVQHVRECSVAAIRRSYPATSVLTDDEIVAQVTPNLTAVHDGYYTVVFAPDDRVTVRIHTQPKDANFAPGEQVASYLCGPENTADYKGFAFVKPTTFNLWKRFKENGRLEKAMRTLMQDPITAGEAFALESGRCWRCNHLLTVPASIHRGLGPKCAGIVGL